MPIECYRKPIQTLWDTLDHIVNQYKPYGIPQTIECYRQPIQTLWDTLDQGCATCGPRATTRPPKPFSAALACSTTRLNQVQICCWDNHRRGPKRKSRQPRTLLVRRFLSRRSKRFMFNIQEEFVTLGLYSYRSTGD